MHITHTYTVQLSSSRFGEKTLLRVSIRRVPAFYRKSEERARWKHQNLHDWKEKHVSVPHLNAAGDELQQKRDVCVKAEGVADACMAIYSRVNRIVPIMQPPKKEAL